MLCELQNGEFSPCHQIDFIQNKNHSIPHQQHFRTSRMRVLVSGIRLGIFLIMIYCSCVTAVSRGSEEAVESPTSAWGSGSRSVTAAPKLPSWMAPMKSEEGANSCSKHMHILLFPEERNLMKYLCFGRVRGAPQVLLGGRLSTQGWLPSIHTRVSLAQTRAQLKVIFSSKKKAWKFNMTRLLRPMGSPVCSHRDGGHPLASWLFQEPWGFDLLWLKSGKSPGWGHASLEQGIIPRRMSKRELNVRLWQFLWQSSPVPGLDCTQYKYYYWSFELKRGFVNRFHVHLKAKRVNKCEIKILAELISLNLRLINYRVCNNSLEKSIPQTCKAWRTVRYIAKQQRIMKCPSFPLKINPLSLESKMKRAHGLFLGCLC